MRFSPCTLTGAWKDCKRFKSLSSKTMNPITRKRIANFKSNKQGYASFLIFIVLFTVSIFAEFIANDKPILVSYKNELYFPIFKSYPETTFNGDFETETDYHDPYIVAKINAQGWIINPVIPYSYNTINYSLETPAPSAPTTKNWLGTDDEGRDVSARLIYGFRVSILFGLALTVVSSVIGIAAGAIQGYFGGLIDLIFQRFIEIWSGLPLLFMLIILSSFVEPNFWWLLSIMLMFSWMDLVGVVRAEFLKTRNYEYVKAARALGVGEFRIIIRHILPNAFTAALTFIPFVLNGSIATLTSLDFLGFGLPAGSASLGELLSQGKNNPQAPWLGITGFFTLALLLSLLIFIGEAFRDAMNPRRTRV